MKTFFEALWPADFFSPKQTEFLTFWLHRKSDKEKFSQHYAFSEIPENWDDVGLALAAFNEESAFDVYFGLGSRNKRLTSFQRGKKEDVGYLPALALDVDIRASETGVHSAQNLPENREAAIALLQDYPTPSALVDSGYGLHAYWFFKEPEEMHDPDMFEGLTHNFWAVGNARALKEKLQFDKVHTIDRVFRVPGFINKKNDEGRRCEIISIDAKRRYALKDLPVLQKTFRVAGSLSTDRNLSETSASTGATRKIRGKPSEMAVSFRFSGELASLIDKLKTLTNPESRELCLPVVEGRSLAPPGQRDITMQRVCSILAFAGPEYTDEQLIEVLSPSLRAMSEEPGAELTFEDELEKAYEKLARARNAFDNQKAQHEALIAPLRRVLRQFDEEESCKDQGLKLSADDVVKRSIVLCKTVYYVFDFNLNQYSHALMRDEVVGYTKRAFEGRLEIGRVNEKGKFVPFTLAQLLHEYGIVAEKTVYSLSAQTSYFDVASSTFTEATCPLRVKEARYDEQVNGWLQSLTDNEYDREQIINWLSYVTRLQQPCAALYLEGPPNVGKSLFVDALSRLWTEFGPTMFTSAVGSFNEAILHCPLVVLDEGLKGDHKNDFLITMRTLVADRSRELRIKYRHSASAHGALRFLITANNDAVLASLNQAVSADDVEAFLQRFYHVRVSLRSSIYLQNLLRKDPDILVKWVQEDIFAKHVLWLVQNRHVQPVGRFMIETKRTSLHTRMFQAGSIGQSIHEWLVKVLLEPKKLERAFVGKTAGFVVGNGQYLINASCVRDYWDVYMPRAPVPSITMIGRVLGGLALAADKEFRPKGFRHRYHRVDMKVIYAWMEDNDVMGVEKVEKLLEREIDLKALFPAEIAEEDSSEEDILTSVEELYKDKPPGSGEKN